MWQYNNTPDELYHYGVLGMKWGRRRGSNYKSKGLMAKRAKKDNDKVDKSFEKWKENANKKETAISLGKKANLSKMNYLNDRSNKEMKKVYRLDSKSYKKALRNNTAWRKGDIRGEVGKDLSRKHMSNAKKIKKQLDKDPDNKILQKEYSKHMSLHDVERAKARKAPSVGHQRSNRKASIKRGMTMTVKAAATAGTITAGAYATNKYLEKHSVTRNGENFRLKTETLFKVKDFIDKGRKIMSYLY